MTSSINTNIAAFFAQANIAAASQNAQSSVARLSSGNVIVQASDNVAALATGTSLQAQVSALKTAQTNASQGTSLLQVADGALAQIGNILQQQQSLALQAGSGALTNTTRGFLNQQFQALTNEINILSTGTSFNGVQLIDGSIATGGSSSSNIIQNNALVSSATTITPSGFTDLTGVTNQSKAGFTYATSGSSFTGSATGFTAATVITQPANSYDKSLYGDISTTGTFTTTAVGGVGAITAYNINYTAADGTVYSGSIAPSAATGTLTSGSITLTATTNASTHATLKFTVGATGFTTASDNSLAIDVALKANVSGYTFTSGTFNAAPTIVQPTGGKADASLYGDLSQGAVKVELAIDANTTTASTAAAKGYKVTYTLNGTAYSGFLAGTNGTTGTAGSIGVAAAQTVTLSSGDDVNHATIAFTTNTQFGATVAAQVDQTANVLSALQANLAGATAFNATKAGSVTGEITQTGIGSVSFTSAPTKNDTTFVGDLSKGVFAVSGSAVSGYAVSYSLNGSTYQGNFSASEVTNGGTLALTNGTGVLAYSISAGATTTTTSSTLQTALTNQFSAATAHASHLVASTLQSNGAGGTIAGSAITSASTAGSLLNGFDGSKAILKSDKYGASATNLPPVSNFAATGSGTSVVFSVQIGTDTYTTQGTVTTAGPLSAGVFDGTTGKLNFYKNGDKANNANEVLTLDLTGLGASARFDSAAGVANFAAALNSAFGGGGSTGSGGLSFQLGSTTSSTVTVNIGSAKTTALFGSTALDISTQAGSTTAAGVVASAISTVTSLRAGVGALESQFNFAAAALQTSVQNQDAARGQFLDTDISTESTSYATSQVKLQAGISVLAQANQSLQALLKLIQ